MLQHSKGKTVIMRVDVPLLELYYGRRQYQEEGSGGVVLYRSSCYKTNFSPESPSIISVIIIYC